MVHSINGLKFVTLFYDSDINRFVDGFGNVIHDIFRLITPGQLMLFRERKGMDLINDVTNSFKVTLIYLD
jgi:hypothetical protein